MSVTVDGRTVYRIGEALRLAGLSRATYFRWIQLGRIADARYRDRNGRRVLTEDELRLLVSEANKVVEASPQLRMQLDSAAEREA